mmetsp:Transcript_6699/g.15689  ORF Transcript_6699/g.15689 Transcript_6699/m.15689 type:complete len:281 (-) Transcript_6699:165-1007(-)
MHACMRQDDSTHGTRTRPAPVVYGTNQLNTKTQSPIASECRGQSGRHARRHRAHRPDGRTGHGTRTVHSVTTQGRSILGVGRVHEQSSACAQGSCSMQGRTFIPGPECTPWNQRAASVRTHHNDHTLRIVAFESTTTQASSGSTMASSMIASTKVMTTPSAAAAASSSMASLMIASARVMATPTAATAASSAADTATATICSTYAVAMPRSSACTAAVLLGDDALGGASATSEVTMARLTAAPNTSSAGEDATNFMSAVSITNFTSSSPATAAASPSWPA